MPQVTVTLGRVGGGNGYSIGVSPWKPIVHQNQDDDLSWDWQASSGLDIKGAEVYFFAFSSRFVGTPKKLGSPTAKANKTGKVKKSSIYTNKTNQYRISIFFEDNGGPGQVIRLDPEYRVEF